MAAVETLITDHLDLWTAALKRKSSAGRGSSSKVELYGVRKLRELILELAVRGLLVPQDPNDEPAGELLKKITAEKAKLIKVGKIKKDKPLPAVADDEKPFALPLGWVWCRLADLAFSQAGYAFKANAFNEIGQGLPLIRIRDVGQPFSGTYFSGEYREEFLVKSGDYLISMDGNFRVAPWTGQDALLNQRVSRLLFHVENVAQKFVADSLQLRLFDLQGTKAYTTVDHLSGGQISQSVIAFPPLAEQHRIVAKVDELMALCDQLEQQTDASLGAHQTLVETLLSVLTSAADHAQFASAWQRIAGHFDTLFTTEESIAQLKQTILQLAVMGKLVPQDPNDEPASELLKKIAAEKAKLVKEGKIKKDKPFPPISDNEVPFELPDGWAFCRLQEAIDVRDGTHDSPKDATGVKTYPLVTSKNFINGGIDFDSARQISEEDHLEISKRSLVEVDDILFSMIGGNIGNQVMVCDSRPFSVKNVALFKYFLKSATYPRFFFLYTQELAAELQNQASGGAQPFVALGYLRNLVLALPPIAEQERIVAKVDELIVLCDQLKSRLCDAQTTQLHLADALVARAIC